MSRIKAYYYLAKPGIVYGNAIAAIGGFLLASRGQIDPFALTAMLIGVSLVMASGCVFNNYIDRGIDLKMERTKKRAIPTGLISNRAALVYGSVLGVVGTILLVMTTQLAAYIGVFGLFAYVILYGVGKRRTVHGTLIGSISGATPPVIGYVAVTGSLDMVAWLLFLIMAIWQMPHFYAIAMFRAKDYESAGIPVLPLVKSMNFTKKTIIAYIIAFILVAPLLTLTGATGYVYAISVIALGMYWLYGAVYANRSLEDDTWARKAFGGSLYVLIGFCILISVGPLLP